MRAWMVFVVIMSGCATTFERVVAVKTLDEAKAILGAEKPTAINEHPPNAESWYFGWQQCVLFIDGKQRLTKTVSQTGVARADLATVDCSLDAFKEQSSATPYLRELRGAETLEEANARAQTPTAIEKPFDGVERWFYGAHRCAVFVRGKLTQTRVVAEGERATCAVD